MGLSERELGAHSTGLLVPDLVLDALGDLTRMYVSGRLPFTPVFSTETHGEPKTW